MLSDVSLTNAGKFPGKYKKAKQSKELKLTHTQKKYFIFQKEAIYAGAGTLQSPCYLSLVPRALFTGFGGDSCRAPTSKAREKRPGDEVVVIFDLRHPGPIISFTSRVLYFS